MVKLYSGQGGLDCVGYLRLWEEQKQDGPYSGCYLFILPKYSLYQYPHITHASGRENFLVCQSGNGLFSVIWYLRGINLKKLEHIYHSEGVLLLGTWKCCPLRGRRKIINQLPKVKRGRRMQSTWAPGYLKILTQATFTQLPIQASSQVMEEED